MDIKTYDKAWNDSLDRTIEIVNNCNLDLRSFENKESLKNKLKKEFRDGK